MNIVRNILAGSLLSLELLGAPAMAAPLSHSSMANEASDQGLVEQVRHRGWHHGGGWRGRHYGWRRGHHYGWYGPPRRGWHGPRYRGHGYYRPRPRAGVYFGFGAPGYW